MSRSTTDYGIIAALVAVGELVGRQADWRAVHDRQASFLDRVFTADRDARVPDIEALASQVADDLNAFLARRGFPASFHELGPLELG